MFTVYCHINKINGKRYVGITGRDVRKRWLNGKGYQGSIHFNNAINKYGWDNFEHQIIAENLTKTEAEEMEIKLIKELKTQDARYGYNVADGGNLSSKEINQRISDTLRGHTVSESTKEKISKKLIGRKIPQDIVQKAVEKRRGRHLTEEQKRKISESEKGKIVSDETKEKLRIKAKGNKNMLGKKHTFESRQKMSESARKRMVENLDNGNVYNSIKEAASVEDVTWSTIYRHCSGKSKTQKWKYFEK